MADIHHMTSFYLSMLCPPGNISLRCPLRPWPGGSWNSNSRIREARGTGSMIAGLGIWKPTPGIGQNFWICLSSGFLFMCFHWSSQYICSVSVFIILFLSHLSKYSVLGPTSLGSWWSTSFSYKLLLKYEFHPEIESVNMSLTQSKTHKGSIFFVRKWWSFFWAPDVANPGKGNVSSLRWNGLNNQAEDPEVTAFRTFWNKVPDKRLAK